MSSNTYSPLALVCARQTKFCTLTIADTTDSSCWFNGTLLEHDGDGRLFSSRKSKTSMDINADDWWTTVPWKIMIQKQCVLSLWLNDRNWLL